MEAVHIRKKIQKDGEILLLTKFIEVRLFSHFHGFK